MATIDVKLFRSTDTGAPTLSGTAGHMLNVLDAVLLNGYNTKTITITRSGTTATATSTAHGFVQWQVVVISGADQADYNGDFVVTSVPTANTFTFEVANSPATPATGTISCKVAAAGWTQAFSGTNKKVYQQDTAGTERGYLRVDDTGTTSCRVRGYTAMTDVDTGTNPFPTDVQVSGGGYWNKSDAASTATRPWIIVATKRMVYLFINITSTWGTGNVVGCAYGSIKSFKPTTDSYPQLLIAQVGTGTSNNTFQTTSAPNTAVSGHYLASNYANSSFSRAAGKWTPQMLSAGVLSASTWAVPNGPDGKFYTGPVIVTEVDTAGVLRGSLPGIWTHAMYSPSVIDAATYGTFLSVGTGTDFTSGTRFLNMVVYNGVYFLVEVSDTWDD